MKKAATRIESPIDFQQILDAMRPFAKFHESGWVGTVWEDTPRSPVLVRWKDGKETDAAISIVDFERLLNAYRMAGGK
jgi:hypothetical protein